MRKAIIVSVIAALLAVATCYLTSESAIDRQLRLVHAAQAAGDWGSDDCGE